MIWVLIMFMCSDYDHCDARKGHIRYTSEGECRADIPYNPPPLTIYICRRED